LRDNLGRLQVADVRNRNLPLFDKGDDLLQVLHILCSLGIIRHKPHSHIAGSGFGGDLWNEIDPKAISRIIGNLFRRSVAEPIDEGHR